MANEFQRQSALLLEGQLLAGALDAAGLLEGFTATVRNACESVLALSRALHLEPWPHGWNEPCSCHPKPFPAARDYHRRTKHRNRRRKP
jgi:isopentenyldiphosphate isomerase